MVDFIEYVVSELKSKRLSKRNAADLVRQFSLRAAAPAATSVIHPLLHQNTSDLTEQRYSSTFDGEEFFLADHQVKGSGSAAHKVLPGVAYLEMARAAIEHAWTARPESSILELHHTVWAQPAVVSDRKEISIALLPGDEEQLEYEVYSHEGDQETVHCQGRASLSREPAPAALDLEQLARQMERGAVEPDALYAECARIGLQYGPSFRAIFAIRRGDRQLLAELQLPDALAGSAGDYVLHPSLMDGSLQAALGLLEGGLGAAQPRLPFALEMLRILSPCTQRMVAWVRYAAGSQPEDAVVKIDVDLCDAQGNVCVQMRGVSSRVLTRELEVSVPQGEAAASPAATPAISTEPTQQPARVAAAGAGSLGEKTQDYLRREFSELLRVPPHEIDVRAALENYGIDSILAMKLTTQLEKTFGSLPKTLFFEYQTIRELAEYFVANHAGRVQGLFATSPAERVESAPVPDVVPAAAVPAGRARRSRKGRGKAKEAEPIAIIGLSGRYPEAVDLEAYWTNLAGGKDCIVEVPKERWDWREYFSTDRTEPGRHYSKWGGFIEGVDEFDPLFFNISPADAEMIDPQERLFLQHAWMAVEDAGYTRASLQVPHENDLPGQVGVYVGVMYTEYQLFGADAAAQGRRMGVASSASSVANRVSYALNLHGPSMTLDTMCSSSLSAIHIACQDLKEGRTSLAIAGGVNVSIHPNKYLVLSAGQFISSDGHCQSFGEGGDGYIPGEGVGAVVLKRLSDAKRDGDHIYGIIRGSALNHGGKTNGYTVPNPQAQATVVSRALAEAHVDPRHVSYIEAHGTGTKLGDPIEIAALSKAFHRRTDDTGYCLIGSAKSNVGHCESAAGIAGLTKILLQMQHRQIAPSLHSAQLNPHIDFEATPFVVNQELRPWERPVIDGRTLPRIAGISSFGAGGSNAHMIIEEVEAPVRQPLPFDNAVIVLSAKTPDRLRQKVQDLLSFLEPRLDAIDLVSLAWTLQVGREAMEERLGLIVSSAADLAEKLRVYLAGQQRIEDSWRGQVKRNNETLLLFSDDADLRQTVERWSDQRRFARLLELWVKGVDIDWSRLYAGEKPARMSLPVYPFARERYWVDITAGAPVAAKGGAVAVLHPLLHSNTSDLSEQRYTTTFTGEELFLADHQVRLGGSAGDKVLPGVAYLEMARAAIEHALPAQPEGTLELRDTVWLQPLVVSGSRQVSIALLANENDEIDYEVYSQGEETVVHCQGRAVFNRASAPVPLDLAQLAAGMGEGTWQPERIYAQCARMGLMYGPSFQGITSVERGNGQLLAHLRLPKTAESSADAYVLHPSLLDGALQAAVALLDDADGQPRVPFALDSLRLIAPCTSEMVAWLRFAPGSGPGESVVKLDVDLCDLRGNVCVQLRGVSSRALSGASLRTEGTLLAAPVWQAQSLVASVDADDTDHHVILCELPKIDAGELATLISSAECVSLPQGSGTLAQRYTDHAVACFKRIQSLMQSRTQRRVLVQVVASGEGEQAILAGLSGLLRTAALENPRVAGQVVLVPRSTTTEELARELRAEMRAADPLVKYESGVRHVLGWQEVAVDAQEPPSAFREDGVYLITGGLGVVGLLFARQILEETRGARVVLTGRSPLSAARQAQLDGLSADGQRVTYRHLDLEDLDQVRQLIASVVAEHGQLNGLLHSAGTIADSFILRKRTEDVRTVLGPKVTGTFHLDEATRIFELDFFALFSSIAGAIGNPGQADYAAANGFMDHFAAYRNREVAAQRRHGRTVSLNWPLWQDGGMSIDAAQRELLRETTGMQPMQTATGLAALHRALALPYDQVLVVEGDLALVRRAMLGGSARPAETQAAETRPAAQVPASPVVADGDLLEKTHDFLRRELSGLLKLTSHRIDPYAPLEQYGIDSVLAMKLTNQLEKTFGSLSRTLFFEYQTIHDLAEYFSTSHAAQLTALLSPNAPARTQAPAPAAAMTAPAATKLVSSRRFSRAASPASATAADSEPIAIIGLSGRYPEAADVEAYWENLREGKDCIVEVPRERWDWREYFSEDRSRSGHHFSKWGGFIPGVDEFDPMFFNISGMEAELMDPQERLFLQHAWMAVEDAGYTRASLQAPHASGLPGQVGVYVGVMNTEYQLLGAEASARGKRMGVAGSTASISNRVSYTLNLHGPSVTLDTMCSSSLTAIHFACLDLKLGRTSLGLAGGVNVTIHPNKYLVLSAGQFISSDGHCQSFGEGGDGYIPGEGVGVVVLKRLSDAKRDGDHIYGIIRGSALNHGGKTNGYTVPNPQAQAGVISAAFAEARIDPRHVSYIEAHGTGTKLGDPIEIAALGKAFRQSTQDSGFCLIGSAKSNIGHCESAAGIAGLTKVLLQMQHGQIVPSLHSAQLNPHIDFETTPFVVNQLLRPWERPVVDGRPLPRIAGISSFGAGGSNAHLIVEEYQAPVQQPVALAQAAILLSARSQEQLRQKAADLLGFIRPRLAAIDLAAVAFTLQAGREAMEERLGFVVSSADELAQKLEAYLAGEQGIEDAYRGDEKRRLEALSLFSADADLKEAIDKWLAHGKLAKLLELWVNGLDVDWSRLYGENRPPRISLPVYPFARDRYWLDTTVAAAAVAAAGATAVLHPLLHSNTSDLSEQRYSSTFTGDEFFLTDHQVQANGRALKVLPGVASLEMARAAIRDSSPGYPDTALLELRNVVWAEPIVVSETKQVSIALSAVEPDQIDYEIYSVQGDGELVHGQGRAILSGDSAPATLDLQELERQMDQGLLDASAVYERCAGAGLLYGPSFQGVQSVRRGKNQLLAQLRLPRSVAGTSSAYVLHPSVMDSALQACVALVDDAADGKPRVPFALDALRVWAPCTDSMVAWIRYSPGSRAEDSVVKLDLDLCDERGKVCVQLSGLSSRALGTLTAQPAASQQETGTLVATPVWEPSAVAVANARQHAEHHVITCELPELGAVDSALPGVHHLSLRADAQKTIAERYSIYALQCFERIKHILQSGLQGQVLVQIAVPDGDEQALLAGLSGLLRTATLENPQLAGQLLLVPPATGAEELVRYLREEQRRVPEPLVRYEGGVRQVLRWQDVPAAVEEAPVAFREQGVYLITGGLGGLGILFAREILERTREAKVVLTGRSPLTAEKQALLDSLSSTAGRVSYRQANLGDLDEVKRLIAGVHFDYHRLNGILHCAGMTADRFILKKDSAEFARVLEPKVTGTSYLDQATQIVRLDWLVLFSSVAGVLGNLGQADYATANAFMDRYAAWRNRQVAAKQRYGRTLSVNWPLWQAGGMGIDAASREMLRAATGMEPMQTATGLQAFHRSLASPYDQVLVVEGDVTRLRHALNDSPRASAAPEPPATVAETTEQKADSLFEKTQDYLRHEFADLLKLPAHRIDPQAALEKYGIDSILALKLTNRLEETFGTLSKTLFFEYQTIAALAGYFAKAHASKLREVTGADEGTVTVRAHERAPEKAPVTAQRPARRGAGRPAAHRAVQQKEIAIVGLAGRYPQAETLQEFWQNLSAGRDSITEVPPERWDHSLYYDPDLNKPGKSYSKWGGFVDGIDKFDPLFFSISPREAALLDPQERFFLQTAWHAIEDAGYSKESISGGRVGVYVGVMWGQYELYGAESILRGKSALASSSYASVANRVSYFFDFHGPSIALDTMCSSSLTAIHLACDELQKGEIDVAIAGGVNLTVHPYKYLSLSLGKFVATDGRCRSFGAGGDGYVPGEGVGAVLLKPLEDALRDGDQIYAIVKSSAVNHGGKTNGYTVPNPNAQANVILDALKKADVDPATLGYIETHGTGTSLGDPIEITGLSRAFEGCSAEKQFCAIGSVKSNIGHLESAAGIAAVTKALLQLKHRQLVPSLHADPLNPHIDFANSPFYVQTELADWKQPDNHPRRVAVSSFGAGGSNAHLILEEYALPQERAQTAGAVPPEAFVLSARDAEALSRYAESVVAFLANASDVSLADLAYTSQVGRTPMAVRLVAIASSVEDLRLKLQRWLATGETDGVFHGDTRSGANDAAGLIDGAAGKALLAEFLAKRDLERLARFWTMGVDLDWSLLSRPVRPRRVSLPTYPFAKERCWIEQETPAVSAAVSDAVSPGASSTARRLYYVPEWSPAPLGEAATSGTILLLDPSEELSLALRARGASVMWVKPGDAYDELVENLKSTDRLPAVVLHHDAGVQSLFLLCKALLKHAPAVMSVFSSGDPQGAAMSGFLKTLALENPKSRTKVVELGDNVTGRAELILAELAERDWTAQEIRYKQNLTRSARRFVALEPRLSAPLPLKRNGVYLITGGLGGLGIIFAEHLAKNFQAKLVLIGRSAPNAAQQERVRQLESFGAEVLVLQADVSRLEDLQRVVGETKARFSELHGVIHSAGVNRDAFILRKSREDFEAVLAPKVSGTINVDLATKDEQLDCFILFSSVAAAAGNPGQSDYAYANRFLDAFAESREQQRKAGVRSGRTLSILWPLWEEGGMQLSPDEVAVMEQRTGMSPLPVQEGIRYFEDFLRSDVVQGLALYGVASKMSAWLAPPPKEQRAALVAAAATDSAALVARTEAYLKSVIGEEIQLDPERIGSTDPLESFGLDSVVINRLNARLETDLGPLPKTLLYEHETVRAVAAFLLQETRAALLALPGAAAPADELPVVAPAPQLVSVANVTTQSPAQQRDEDDAIAIIGIHGTYPHSPDLATYWENLKQGKDLVDPVPPGRWDAEGLYDPDPKAVAEGKIYCKWGAFLEDYDKFDPRFFNISPQEAGMLDPQERLFLESVWAAIEDAGYTRSSLKARFGKGGSANVGVFVGVTTNSYSLWAPEERARGHHISPTAMPWSIANHVSYFFDFNGPSLPIDTACSSSLVALHLACESLKNGDCQVAIAGGVNLYLHPAKYHSLCQRRMLSLNGHCHSYGAGDDGFVPGEGVGTLVLKPLKKAVEDGDTVYAVVRASAYNHSGRSNGYSAPNPNSQASLITRTLEQGGVHPETIGYVEGHGTGTQLGDSLEIAALTQAFRKQTSEKQFCPIGSVKANLGHSESAAGVAGVAKVILQMQRGQLAPSIHSDEPNPNIEFADSPFYLQHGLSEWPSSPDHPRRALVNSFGAGGVNACAVLEEYVDPSPIAGDGEAGPYLFVLSAKNEDRLREYAGRILARLRGDERPDLASLCYTLQTGREAMEERLAIVVSDADDLADQLTRWTQRAPADHVQRGTAASLRASMRSARLTKRDHSLAELASRWVAGEAVDWESLYPGNPPRRIPLPTYPFARERYWIPEAPVQEQPAPLAAQLHPLIAHNSSTLKEVSFSSSLSDTAFYAADHRVHDEKVFPGAGLLEMACISGNLAGEQRVWKIRDVVWIQPLLFHGGPQPVRTALRYFGETVEYVMSSFDDDNETVVHSEGRLVFGNGRPYPAGEEDRLPLADLKARSTRFEDGAAFYAKFSEFGLHYGPAFRTVQELHIADTYALAKLKIADHLKGDFGQFILHPSLIDGALQTVAALAGNVSPRTPHLPFALDELELLRPLPQTCYAYAQRAGAGGNHAGIACFNIRLLNEHGDVLVELKNLYVRPLARPLPPARSLVGAERGF